MVCVSKEGTGTNNKRRELSIKLSVVLYVTGMITVLFCYVMKGKSVKKFFRNALCLTSEKY